MKLFVTAILLAASSFGLALDRDRRDRRDDRRGRAQSACFYVDSDFRNLAFCLRPGQRMPNLNTRDYNFNDSISSIRIDGNMTVVIHEHDNSQGDSAVVYSDVRDLSREYRDHGDNWNDQISSIEVQH